MKLVVEFIEKFFGINSYTSTLVDYIWHAVGVLDRAGILIDIHVNVLFL
jgi:hypothetical protein